MGVWGLAPTRFAPAREPFCCALSPALHCVRLNGLASRLVYPCRPGVCFSAPTRSSAPHEEGRAPVLRAQAVFWMQMAQTALTVFSFCASISDLFIFLEKLDLTLVSLFVTCGMDWYCTSLISRAARARRKAPSVEKRRYARELTLDFIQ